MSVRQPPRQRASTTTSAHPLLSYTSSTGSNFRLVDRPMVAAAGTASGYMPVYPAHLQSHLDSPYVTSTTAAPYRYHQQQLPMTASRYYAEAPMQTTAASYYSNSYPVPQTQKGWTDYIPFEPAGYSDGMSDAWEKGVKNAGRAALLSGGLTAGIYAQSKLSGRPA